MCTHQLGELMRAWVMEELNDALIEHSEDVAESAERRVLQGNSPLVSARCRTGLPKSAPRKTDLCLFTHHVRRGYAFFCNQARGYRASREPQAVAWRRAVSMKSILIPLLAAIAEATSPASYIEAQRVCANRVECRMPSIRNTGRLRASSGLKHYSGELPHGREAMRTTRRLTKPAVPGLRRSRN